MVSMCILEQTMLLELINTTTNTVDECHHILRRVYMSYIFATNKMHRSEITITKWFVLVTEINKNKNTSYKTVVCSSRKLAMFQTRQR